MAVDYADNVRIKNGKEKLNCFMEYAVYLFHFVLTLISYNLVGAYYRWKIRHLERHEIKGTCPKLERCGLIPVLCCFPKMCEKWCGCEEPPCACAFHDLVTMTACACCGGLLQMKDELQKTTTDKEIIAKLEANPPES
eukprot:47379_1